MNPIIHVRARQPEIEKYQEILRTDWSKETLDDVLSLLWKLIAGSATPSTFEWQKVLEFDTAKVSSKDLNQQVITRIQELSEVFTERFLPPMPRTYSGTRSTRSVAQAEKCWAFFIIQALARLEGETGLFQDTQSLLFLCAIHYLLPHLKSQRLMPEHDCLVRAMYVHTLLVWRQRPEHLFYLQSLAMDYLGEPQRRLELLEQSLRLTSFDDHSYLTKASAYWADLLDLGLRQQALRFLLFLTRVSPQSSNDEIGEMIKETVGIQNGEG